MCKDEVVISRREFIALHFMVRFGINYGLDLVRISKGRLKRHNVYFALRNLEEAGLVSSEKEGNSPNLSRRKYIWTEAGGDLVQQCGHDLLKTIDFLYPPTNLFMRCIKWLKKPLSFS